MKRRRICTIWQNVSDNDQTPYAHTS